MKISLKKFITSCTLTFKAFDHEVEMSSSKSTIWHFVATNTRGDKKYCVYCAPIFSNAKNMIRIALKKVPENFRLVVVTAEQNDEEKKKAEDDGYCLTTLDALSKYGTEMLDIKQKEAAKNDREYLEEKYQIDLDKERIF